MRAISLFSGVGGFELGFDGAGIETVLQVESDPWCQQVLGYRFPNIALARDVREPLVFPSSIDLVYGGFPCQDASLAGNRKGFKGERTSLWWDFVRIVGQVQPAWVVAENVAGFLTANDGEDFRSVLGSLDELGYGVAWRVLDAYGFGVPQQRRRLFLVGHLGGQRAADVLALAEAGDGDAGAAVAEYARHPQRSADGDPERGRAVSFIERTRPDGRRLEWMVERAPSLTSGNGGGRSDIGNICFNGQARQLLPVERERLLGWPDDWTRWGAGGAEIPRTHRLNMTGNGVAAPVTRWLGDRLIAVA